MMKAFRSLLVLALFTVVALPAHAGHGGGQCPAKGACSMHDGCGKGAQSDCSEGGGCPISGKLMKKAWFFLSNKDEIGLSEEQVAKIKAIKVAAKKRAIQDGANMQVWMLDLDAKLSEEKVDVEGLNALVDQGMTGFNASAKESIKAYAELKSVLTADQMTKAKAIWLGKTKKA